MKENKTFAQQIQDFIELFPKMTKDESDFILEVLNWSDEKRAAFVFAKRIFDEEDDVDQDPD